MEIFLGKSTRYLRERLGLKQKEMANELGISVVHYCNIENSKSIPSIELLEKFRDIWGIDLYVLGWCKFGDTSKLPKPLQESAIRLAHSWEKQLDEKLSLEGKE